MNYLDLCQEVVREQGGRELQTSPWTPEERDDIPAIEKVLDKHGIDWDKLRQKYVNHLCLKGFAKSPVMIFSLGSHWLSNVSGYRITSSIILELAVEQIRSRKIPV